MAVLGPEGTVLDGMLGIAWGELPHWTRGPSLVLPSAPLPSLILASSLLSKSGFLHFPPEGPWVWYGGSNM